MKVFLDIYHVIFGYIAAPRLLKNDIDPRVIHNHCCAVLTTGLLMWAYAALAFSTISNPIPAYIGLTCSIVHLLTPVLFRFSSNKLLICSVMLLAGVIHQSSFAYFSGGYGSHILIWFGIIPMLGGIIAGRAGIMIWAAVVTIVSAVFLGLELNNYPFPDSITPAGHLISHSFLVFGWIMVVSGVIFLYDALIVDYEKTTHEKSEKIDALLRILLHDISNSIQIIANTRHLTAKYMGNNPGLDKIINQINRHTVALINTITSVKNMYIVDLGKDELELKKTSLPNSIDYVKSFLEEHLNRKELKLNYDETLIKNLEILVVPNIFHHQILINILSNCIKFSPNSGSIDIWVTPNFSNSNKINLHIKDHGIGIPKKLLDNLFNPHYKTTRKGTNDESGTGLGMLIMRSMVEKMQGNLQIISNTEEESGQPGTEFILTFLKA